MKLTQWIVCIVITCLTPAIAIEWDAKQLEVGAGSSWAFYNADGYGSGPVFNLIAGGHVPVLVEQHLRIAALSTFSFAPIYAQEEGEIGGNYSALKAKILIEHDFSMGDRIAWAGLGVQGSIGYSFNHFKVLESGKSELIDSFISTSASVVGRLVLPINSVYAVSLDAQFSPLDQNYSALGAAVMMQF
jgi:hypothetical protein